MYFDVFVNTEKDADLKNEIETVSTKIMEPIPSP